MNQPLLLGIDIGGTKIRLATALPHAPEKLLYTITIPTPRSFADAQPDILQAAHILLEGSTVVGIGVSSPGPVDRKRGSIGHPTNLHWTKAPIVAWLKKQWQCPVELWNDATAAAISEAQFGSARKYRYALYVSVSTGIGTALTLDGWPLPGLHNQEGGRMILGLDEPYTTFQATSSGTAIVKEYGHIAAKIRNPHHWTAISKRLAVGLHNLVVAADPEIIVLGGGVSLHHKRFFPALSKEIQKLHPLYPFPPIVPAHAIEHAPLIGALAAVSDSAGLASLPKPRV
jgi:glucokinase